MQFLNKVESIKLKPIFEKRDVYFGIYWKYEDRKLDKYKTKAILIWLMIPTIGFRLTINLKKD